MALLELKEVTYRYLGTTKDVLKGINISFESSKMYCIVGKSGSGKTTMLSLLAGLDICTTGEINYNGKNVKKIDRDKYRSTNIGVIFQSYNLLTNATAIDNIILSMNVSRVKEKNKKEYAYKLLASVGIDQETANRKVLKLSGGEQQRVGIARALAHNPDIIIADEPTGNLDSDTKDEMLAILKNLAYKENKCVIVVTHSKQIANSGDELWALKDGNLLFVK